jgi:hypothetical protein
MPDPNPPGPRAAPRPAPNTVPRPVRLYGWGERPRVEVLHDDGHWYPGQLRAWRHAGAEGWRAMVTYHVAVGRQHYREVPAASVRPAPEGDAREGTVGSTNDSPA